VVLDAAAGPATWLAVVMAVNVAIGLVYYLRWLVQLFLPAEQPGASRYDVPNGVAVAIGMTATAGVVFSVAPGWLLDPVLTVLG
jgi:NADH-quinone oxidoreductase subunit N